MCSQTNEKEATLAVEAPEKIEKRHKLANFDCGKDSLNSFLRKRAFENAKNHATATYVVCYKGANHVAGYFSLATGAVIRGQAPKAMQRNMPNDIPVVVLARLAVDIQAQGQGLGEELLAEAIERALNAAEHVAVRALLVHALDEDAARFYKNHGFIEMPHDPMILMLSLKGRST